MNRHILLSFVVASLISCNKIETGDTLTKKDFERFKSLRLLDSNEKVIRFYSEYRKSVAGNFYTNKRLAKYWIDEHNSTKNINEFAFYKDIAKLDTFYYAGLTWAPFILVTRKNGSTFKVSVEGSRKEVADFFAGAINEWEK